MTKAIRATLRYLFHEYLKGPNVAYSINSVTSAYNVDPIKLSDLLLERNWIRERWVYQDELVSCRITVAGIEEIDSAFIHNKLREIIGSLVEAGGTKDLTEIFQSRIEEYAINLDIVFQLEKLAMVEIRHRRGSLIVSLTDYGRQFFLKKGTPLFTLLSIA